MKCDLKNYMYTALADHPGLPSNAITVMLSRVIRIAGAYSNFMYDTTFYFTETTRSYMGLLLF